MKVLQLGKFYPIRGGVEKVMYDLMLGLSERGIDCDMLCASTEDHPAGVIQLNNYAKLIVVGTKIKVAATMLAPTMITMLKRICKQYDIIHIHHPDPMAALALSLSGFKGKVVLHWHSDILKQKNLLKLYKPLQQWLISRADVIVGTTPVYVERSPFLGKFQHKLDYIPIGVSSIANVSADLVVDIKERYKGKFVAFSLGRLVEYKGYEYLVQSAVYLPADCKIVIGGKGPLYDSLKALIVELKVEDKVELLGFLSDEEAYAYFNACDVFVLSSILKTEAFAIVQIEAMSCSKPIITAEIPESGVSWVNEDGTSGIVVERQDGKAIAEAIIKLKEDAVLYDKLALGSKNRFVEKFNTKIMIDKTVAIYRSL